jgi:hypothetical protein
MNRNQRIIFQLIGFLVVAEERFLVVFAALSVSREMSGVTRGIKLVVIGDGAVGKTWYSSHLSFLVGFYLFTFCQFVDQLCKQSLS